MFKQLIFAIITLFSVAALSSFSIAQEADYLDNRSTPKTLIASYFNALERSEFARAWSYWDDAIPGTSFEEFVEKNTKMKLIGFKLGQSISEGAAGGIFTQVPVALEIQEKYDQTEVYSGCFLLRLSQPTIQTPPFKPWHFWDSDLKPVQSAFSKTEPGECAY